LLSTELVHENKHSLDEIEAGFIQGILLNIQLVH